ncbi:hypothetical protein MTO96_024741 [Rhipicephalus appendiculatus]
MACDRVAVLAKGEITMVGSVAELKQKFAKGYTVQFVLRRVSEDDAEVFKNYVDVLFPDLMLRGLCQNTLDYYAAKKIVWQEWFEKIAVLEKAFFLQHVYISETVSTQVIVVVADVIRALHLTQNIGNEPAIM